MNSEFFPAVFPALRGPDVSLGKWIEAAADAKQREEREWTRRSTTAPSVRVRDPPPTSTAPSPPGGVLCTGLLKRAHRTLHSLILFKGGSEDTEAWTWECENAHSPPVSLMSECTAWRPRIQIYVKAERQRRETRRERERDRESERERERERETDR